MVQCLIAALLVTGHSISFWDRARLSSVGTKASLSFKKDLRLCLTAPQTMHMAIEVLAD